MPHILYPLNDFYVRRVGRPNKEWVKEVMPDVCALFGSLEQASIHAAQKNEWNRIISEKLGF